MPQQQMLLWHVQKFKVTTQLVLGLILYSKVAVYNHYILANTCKKPKSIKFMALNVDSGKNDKIHSFVVKSSSQYNLTSPDMTDI